MKRSRAEIANRPAAGARGRRRLLARLAWLGLVLALAGLWFVPTGYMTLSPGRPLPLRDAVHISPAEAVPASPPGESGDVLLLTAIARPANPYRLAAALLGLPPGTSAIPAWSLIPSGMTGEEYLAYNRALMEESVGLASVVAVRAAGGVSSAGGSGVRVFATLPGAGATGLRPGDVLTTLRGIRLRFAGDVAAAVRGLPPGTVVPATVRRNGTAQEMLITLASSIAGAEELMLGALLATEDPVFDTFPAVSADTGGIGGPSGGLALALAVYSRLADEDLLHGRVVAATGQIREDGSVAPVGGIAQKAHAAVLGRADVFLLPRADGAEVRAVAPSLLVVEVSSFDEAVSYLRRSR